MPFKWTAKFNLAKLDRMHKSGDVDLNMADENGQTVRDFCEKRNESVNEAFVITEPQKNDLKDPLVDVLLENNVALTPMQRLLLAVGGQVLQFGVAAGQMAIENKNYIKQFVEESAKSRLNKEEIIRDYEDSKAKKIKQERDAEEQREKQKKTNTQTNKTPPPPAPKKQEPVKETSDDDVKFTPPKSDFDDDDDDDVTSNTTTPPKTPVTPSTSVQPEIKKEDENKGKLDEYLTEANGGITVEEYMDEPNDDV